ncbi:EF-hand domain-containing protein [Diaphorobacter sp.]|uniref:EF-hand domain-containing protein n=1 Tax=Diaphorobacter sp. TaxID=1934310 RepID=UPI00258AC38C|nr:EF-hand domain-containing protein [Diaphorobacter sp.]
MPHTPQRRTLPSFDARSVMLFAALTVGGAAAQAQTPSAPSAQPQYQTGPGNTQPRPNFGPGNAAASSSGNGSSASAFERADANRDGQLSSAEAGQLPAIANRFQALDKDKNGSLSRTEFEAGSRS